MTCFAADARGCRHVGTGSALSLVERTTSVARKVSDGRV